MILHLNLWNYDQCFQAERPNTCHTILIEIETPNNCYLKTGCNKNNVWNKNTYCMLEQYHKYYVNHAQVVYYFS